MPLTSPDGTLIVVRPIEPGELDRIPLRCWPERDALDRLFAEQGTIGMAAWEGKRCVAQLHCYRVMLPDGTNADWPDWNDWLSQRRSVLAAAPALEFTGAVWCHACFHVGRTLESYREEIERGWSPRAPGTEPGYSGRRIGTALCRESVRWAREHDYVAVLAPGAPDGLIEYAAWAGHLPWTRYAKLGFETVDVPEHGDELPGWARGERRGVPEYLVTPPEVMAEVRGALDAGRPPHEFRERLMMLHLTRRATSQGDSLPVG